MSDLLSFIIILPLVSINTDLFCKTAAKLSKKLYFKEKNMDFRLISGVSVLNLSELKKEYRLKKDGLIFSLSADDYHEFFTGAVKRLSEPVFFFLEIPADNDSYRTYYLECTVPVALAILKRYRSVLYNDGVIRWGFGSHKTGDEIYMREYQTICLYSEKPEGYKKLLEQLGYKNNSSAKLVWDIISEKNPGECVNIEADDETYIDMLNNLIEVGMYPEEESK